MPWAEIAPELLNEVLLQFSLPLSVPLFLRASCSRFRDLIRLPYINVYNKVNKPLSNHFIVPFGPQGDETEADATAVARVGLLSPFSSHIERLALENWTIEPQDADQFASLLRVCAPSLRTLALSGLTNFGYMFQVLHEASSLTSLSLSGIGADRGMGSIAAPLFPSFLQLPNLVCLAYEDTGIIGDSSVQEMLLTCTQLTSLDMSSCWSIDGTAYVLGAIARMTNLTELVLPGQPPFSNSDSEESVLFIDLLPKLTSLRVAGAIEDAPFALAVLEGMLRNSTLKSLSLSLLRFESQEEEMLQKSLARVLVCNSTLTELQLSPQFELASPEVLDILQSGRNTSIRRVGASLEGIDARSIFKLLAAAPNIVCCSVFLGSSPDLEMLKRLLRDQLRFVSFRFTVAYPSQRQGREELEQTAAAACGIGA